MKQEYRYTQILNVPYKSRNKISKETLSTDSVNKVKGHDFLYTYVSFSWISLISYVFYFLSSMKAKVIEDMSFQS